MSPCPPTDLRPYLSIYCNWCTALYIGDGCNKVWEWYNVTGIHSAGGTRLNQFYTVYLCLQACRDLLDNCVGVDIDSRLHDEVRCWVHTDVADFDVTYRAVGLTQYRLVTSCAYPGNTPRSRPYKTIPVNPERICCHRHGTSSVGHSTDT